jgi:FAD/FMN-containing dehydrogenase
MATVEDAQALADVIAPGDAEYEQARRIWNGLIDRRPALIARPRDAREVAAAVLHARRRGLSLAVRSGGHSVPGHSTVDGGLVLDLSAHLNRVEVDPQSRRVRAGGGTLLGTLDRATQEHRLVIPSGHVSHTGVGGLTLGGGTGWLMRRYGLTIDSLRSVELVTAAGEIVRASEHEHPDLFWAVRGGGGNFGVVTEFEFEAHPLGPELVAGMLVYPLEEARERLAFLREFMEDAPDELTTFPVLVTAPPRPPFPAELQGRRILALGLAYAGSVEDGLRAIAPLRAAAPPALDLAGPMPYLALQTMLDASVPHGLHNYNRAEWLDDLSDGAIETLVEQYDAVPSPLSQVILARMGGAVARVPSDATAFPHRGARNLLWMVSCWRPDEDPEPHLAWGRAIGEAMRPFASGGVYVNALGDEPADRVRAAYGANWPRLVELKRRYDPENVFRLNANIDPAAGV